MTCQPCTRRWRHAKLSGQCSKLGQAGCRHPLRRFLEFSEEAHPHEGDWRVVRTEPMSGRDEHVPYLLLAFGELLRRLRPARRDRLTLACTVPGRIQRALDDVKARRFGRSASGHVSNFRDVDFAMAHTNDPGRYPLLQVPDNLPSPVRPARRAVSVDGVVGFRPPRRVSAGRFRVPSSPRQRPTA